MTEEKELAEETKQPVLITETTDVSFKGKENHQSEMSEQRARYGGFGFSKRQEYLFVGILIFLCVTVSFLTQFLLKILHRT
ncbi:unnamed protein product, partial [Hymenolepis diminuta]